MTGIAELPLHTGHVPRWMLKLMRDLAKSIIEIIILEHGPETLLQGLLNPLWFQAFNNVIGMDWDSSGSTTVLTGILKDITWKNPELGIVVLGGKGSKSLKVPDEISVISEVYSLTEAKTRELENASRLAAKADTAFFQDGYQLYHHTLIVTEKGSWIVVQQGMNPDARMARRYHIDKLNLLNVHYGIAGTPHSKITLNLSIGEAEKPLKTIMDLSKEQPRKTIKLIYEANSMIQPSILDYTGVHSHASKHAAIKGYYRPVKPSKHLEKALEALYNASPSKPEELALIRGVGPSTIRALALVSDLIYSIPSPDNDNVTHPIEPYAYSYAVGGKDGIPYPFNSKTARETIEILEYAIREAKLDDKTKLKALKRLRNTLPWWRKHGL